MTEPQVREDRTYFAERAAEEQELVQSATDKQAAAAHRLLQRAYLEKASVGARPARNRDVIG
jgi:hypothetical protein